MKEFMSSLDKTNYWREQGSTDFGGGVTYNGWRTEDEQTGTQLDSRGTTQDPSTTHHLERQHYERHRE